MPIIPTGQTMSTKALLKIILYVMGAFVGLMFIFFALFKIFPSWFGIRMPQAQEYSKVEPGKQATQPGVWITKYNYDKLQSLIIKNKVLQNESDSTNKIYNKLIDSIEKVKANPESAINIQLQLQDSIKKIQAKITQVKDSLTRYTNLYAKAENDLKSFRQKEAQASSPPKNKDSLRKQNLLDYAKIYNNASPSEVAKILEKLSDKDASFILKAMDKKKAGKILDIMSKERAAAILKQG
jgi:flagellar motility protein MotE (MotC chaperone)